MLTRKLRYAGGALAGAALLASLTGCAPEPVAEPASPPPTMAPEQSVAEACGVSSDEIDAIVSDVRQQIEDASSVALSGEVPDLGGIGASVGDSLSRVSEGVINPEVSAALDEVRAELDGFGEIQMPESLLEAPAYIADLTAQLSDLQAAGKKLQQLCDAG